jgi:hypothetical protein
VIRKCVVGWWGLRDGGVGLVIPSQVNKPMKCDACRA